MDRLDERTTVRDRIQEDLDYLLVRTDLYPVHVPATPRELPAGVIASAMFSWLALVFFACYIVAPIAMAVTGLTTGVLAATPFALPAFAMASIVAVVAACTVRPRVKLDQKGARDPVISATVGGLGVLAIVHNASPLLMPFSAMGPAELLAFLTLNVVEMTMVGMMLASFTRRRSVALALGGGFQLLLMGLMLTLMSIALL